MIHRAEFLDAMIRGKVWYSDYFDDRQKFKLALDTKSAACFNIEPKIHLDERFQNVPYPEERPAHTHEYCWYEISRGTDKNRVAYLAGPGSLGRIILYYHEFNTWMIMMVDGVEGKTKNWMFQPPKMDNHCEPHRDTLRELRDLAYWGSRIAARYVELLNDPSCEVSGHSPSRSAVEERRGKGLAAADHYWTISRVDFPEKIEIEIEEEPEAVEPEKPQKGRQGGPGVLKSLHTRAGHFRTSKKSGKRFWVRSFKAGKNKKEEEKVTAVEPLSNLPPAHVDPEKTRLDNMLGRICWQKSQSPLRPKTDPLGGIVKDIRPLFIC